MQDQHGGLSDGEGNGPRSTRWGAPSLVSIVYQATHFSFCPPTCSPRESSPSRGMTLLSSWSDPLHYPMAPSLDYAHHTGLRPSNAPSFLLAFSVWGHPMRFQLSEPCLVLLLLLSLLSPRCNLGLGANLPGAHASKYKMAAFATYVSLLAHLSPGQSVFPQAEWCFPEAQEIFYRWDFYSSEYHQSCRLHR